MAVIQKYSMTEFQDEVRTLVARGSIGRQQRIYELKKYFANREWDDIAELLDTYDYVLRGHIIDLVGAESWTND
jgi:hypothetical protein